MKLNHVNLTVSDVRAAVAFLKKYFGMRGEVSNDGFAALFDSDGLVLTLMRGREVAYPRTFHIGFAQADEAAVNAIYERMVADGLQPEPPQRSHAWTFYVEAPGGFTVEVLA